MSVFRSGETPPAWCELTAFETLALGSSPVPLPVADGRRRLLVTKGQCRVTHRDGAQVFAEGQFCDLDAGAGPYTAEAGHGGAEVLLFSGRWGTELGGCGIFRLTQTTPASVRGDPVDYPKSTNFDSHYHDCDEYWVILEGGGTVVVGSRHHEVGPGDCVAIGMGHHHDIARLSADLKGAYFETTLEGAKRFGHLWEHTHGTADVRPDRV